MTTLTGRLQPRVGPVLAGLLAGAGVGFSGLAWMHAKAVNPFGAPICGVGGSEHCAWCFAALTAFALSLFVLTREAADA